MSVQISFHEFIRTKQDESTSQKQDNFYSVDVVADAYSQGFKDGANDPIEFKKQLKKLAIERFINKSNNIYVIVSDYIKHLKNSGINVSNLYGNFTHRGVSILISIPNEQLLDDDLNTIAYQKLYEISKSYTKENNEFLDVSLISDSNIDAESILKNGYTFTEMYE